MEWTTRSAWAASIGRGLVGIPFGGQRRRRGIAHDFHLHNTCGVRWVSSKAYYETIAVCAHHYSAAKAKKNPGDGTRLLMRGRPCHHQWPHNRPYGRADRRVGTFCQRSNNKASSPHIISTSSTCINGPNHTRRYRRKSASWFELLLGIAPTNCVVALRSPRQRDLVVSARGECPDAHHHYLAPCSNHHHHGRSW
jgi:hypothetical protein